MIGLQGIAIVQKCSDEVEMRNYTESLFLVEPLDKCDIEDPDLEGEVMCEKTRCLYNLDRFQEALQFIGRVNAEVSHLNLSDSDISRSVCSHQFSVSK
ncbi:unnamed protein product [Clavelina lepadiformis]|uniref:Uncharacterized protein n=1 Tax=Clavelina lepadiformis TaxID=159417 RepID=A0ABP0EZY1_CLALP